MTTVKIKTDKDVKINVEVKGDSDSCGDMDKSKQEKRDQERDARDLVRRKEALSLLRAKYAMFGLPEVDLDDIIKDNLENRGAIDVLIKNRVFDLIELKKLVVVKAEEEN